MKNKIVLVPFPFDDLKGSKIRPAVCLTEVIHPHRHIVLAFITSAVTANSTATDLVLDIGDTDFAQTGLRVSSTIKLHRLVTVSTTLVKREIGSLSISHQNKVEDCLRKLFDI